MRDWLAVDSGTQWFSIAAPIELAVTQHVVDDDDVDYDGDAACGNTHKCMAHEKMLTRALHTANVVHVLHIVHRHSRRMRRRVFCVCLHAN